MEGCYILGLDPSNVHTAYAVLELPSLKPVEFGFLPEDEMLDFVERATQKYKHVYLAIEGVQNLGMIVGQTVFDTCVLVGRLLERAKLMPLLDPLWDDWKEDIVYCGTPYRDIRLIYRKQEKMNLCGTMRSKDKDIKEALVKRFAPDTPNDGKGSKKNQGWFYGVAKDIWSAIAVGVTYYDLYLKQAES